MGLILRYSIWTMSSVGSERMSWQWEDGSVWQKYSPEDEKALETAFQSSASHQSVCNGYVLFDPCYDILFSALHLIKN